MRKAAGLVFIIFFLFYPFISEGFVEKKFPYKLEDVLRHQGL